MRAACSCFWDSHRLGLLANHALSDGSSALSTRNAHAALTDASTAETYAPWSDQPYILAGRAWLRLDNRREALASFRRATRHDPSDWVAWEGLMQTSTGAEHAAAR